MNETATVRARSPAGRPWLPDVTVPALAVAVLVGACALITSRRPYLWFDEAVTRLFLDDPNAVHLVRTVAAGGENNPPLYHLLLRAWASVAGTSTFALRLPSALFVAAAFVLLWRALRREFPWPAVAIALGLTFFPADAVLDQVAQARFYGLFLFSGAAAVATALEVARREQPGPWLLSATGASHLLLLYSHTFGILYSAAIVAALGVLDARARRLRAAPYLAIAAAWLAFVPWIPWVLEQGKMARPTAWIAPPTFRRLSGVMQRLTSPLSLVVAGVGLVALLRRRFGPVAVSIPRNPIAPTVVIGGSVAAVAPLVWLESRLAIPIFVDRYVLPSALGWPLIVAPVIAAVLMRMRDRVATIAGAAAFALLASSALLAAGRRERTQAPDTLVAPAARFAPVVVESAIDFLPLHIYQSPRERYVFPLDWELALAQPEVAWSIQEYKLMALFARAGYLADDALVTTRLLCDADEFAVLESAHHQWLERRVRTDSTWSVTPVEGGSSRLWLVRRRGLRSCAGISAEEPLVHPDRAAADR